tara:strand:- start:325 stop:645 length:321 start_codon:yes stop_codon:yes gene_type:complete
MKNYTYNLGMNKGNFRIWIEGNTLLKEGFNCGDKFDKEYGFNSPYENRLVLKFSNEGKSKIAGNASRPIIDLNGKFLNPIFSISKKYRLSFGLKGNKKAIFIDAVI